MNVLQNSSTVDIKKNNYKIIYNLFFRNEKLSKQDVATMLNLSLPTVTQNLNKLEKKGLIKKDGLFNSQGGRPAAVYTLCADTILAIGVEISLKSVKIAAVNMKGDIVDYADYDMRFVNDDEYFRTVSTYVSELIDAVSAGSKILGIGISMQAISTADGTKIIYGKVSDCTGLEIDVFQQHFKYPCKFFHDVKSAANREIWSKKDLQDAFYLSIGEHLGGALIINRKIYLGLSGYSGAIEHIVINPRGKLCYCGKRGCLETYCSLSALLNQEETADAFFTNLRKKEKTYIRRWKSFLNVLALTINHIHLLLNQKFIIGGNIAPYLTDEDIMYLYSSIKKKSTFPLEENFISISHIPKDSVTVGAALPFITDYLHSVGIYL